jgi:hypothetical protein
LENLNKRRNKARISSQINQTPQSVTTFTKKCPQYVTTYSINYPQSVTFMIIFASQTNSIN